MPGWRDRIAASSSHPSAQNYRGLKARLDQQRLLGMDGAHTDTERRIAEEQWGIRYGQEWNGISKATVEEEAAAAVDMQAEQGWDFTPNLNMPMPGTAEFTARYIPPGEPVIEQIEAVGPEGFRIVRKVDGVTGELIAETNEVIGDLGPGEIVHDA